MRESDHHQNPNYNRKRLLETAKTTLVTSVGFLTSPLFLTASVRFQPKPKDVRINPNLSNNNRDAVFHRKLGLMVIPSGGAASAIIKELEIIVRDFRKSKDPGHKPHVDVYYGGTIVPDDTKDDVQMKGGAHISLTDGKRRIIDRKTQTTMIITHESPVPKSTIGVTKTQSPQ